MTYYSAQVAVALALIGSINQNIVGAVVFYSFAPRRSLSLAGRVQTTDLERRPKNKSS